MQCENGICTQHREKGSPFQLLFALALYWPAILPLAHIKALQGIFFMHLPLEALLSRVSNCSHFDIAEAQMHNVLFAQSALFCHAIDRPMRYAARRVSI